MPKSPRFSRDTLQFIEKAGRQKHPEWLDRHRDEYEEKLLAPLHHLAQSLKKALASSANGYHFPSRGIGRLKRSAIRAQEYGSLYRDYVSYSVSRPRKSRFDHNPNLFFLIQPGDPDGDEVLVAGGLYMPSSRQLRAIREFIACDATPFDRLFATKSFAACFPGGFSDERTATRPPRGFDPNHPRMRWLKMQAYFVWRPYKKKEFFSPAFPELVARDWQQILRLNELLEQVLDGRLAARTGVEKKKETRAKGLAVRLEELEAPPRPMDF